MIKLDVRHETQDTRLGTRYTSAELKILNIWTGSQTKLSLMSCVFGLISKSIGGPAQGSHLFPSRTEKLSPAAPMVLGLHPGE